MLCLGLLWLASGVAAWAPGTGPRPPMDDNLATTASPDLPPEAEDGAWYLEALRTVQGYIGVCRRRTGVFNSFDEDLAVSVVRMKYCVKERFLKSLDDALDEKELALNPFITIIKDNSTDEKAIGSPRDDAVNEDLISSISKRFSRMLTSHSFKFSFSDSTENSEEEEEDDEEAQSSRMVDDEGRFGRFVGGRGRRRRQQYRKAFPMMVAGYMMMSAFLVPLGFQFMAMIGGKALLLAKMAFFMSLFSGYKRLTNDLDYHHHVVPSAAAHELLHHYHHGFHHRSAETPTTDAFIMPHHQQQALAQQYQQYFRQG